ncbi:MAG: hypothetical protein J6S57_01510 [Alphaproteobacteria bacterium]|nr:hypothetical protein [Alphaproteobacteria bacterium]
MTFVLNIATGKNYSAYPEKHQEEIELFKNCSFDELFAAFKILDAVYKSNEPFNITVNPCWNWGSGDVAWQYRIKSPIVNQKIYIESEHRDLTPTIPHDESHLGDIKHVDEYTLKIGKLFSYRSHSGVIAYLCQILTEPAKEEYLRQNGNKKFRGLEAIRKSQLLELADKVAPSH